MYHALALILPNSDFQSEEFARRLRERFARFQISANAGLITIATDDWELELLEESGDTVLRESQLLAEKLGGADAAGVASCQRRVEVWSETPDPEIAHLADFQNAIKILKSFQGVIAVEPNEPCFL